jgi:quercetin dioxygenase-like cupin family protein
MAFFDWNGEEGVEVEPGAHVWEARGDTVQVVRTRLAAGRRFETHRHDQEQITVVLEGRLEVTQGDETRIVGAGGVVHAKSGVPHATVVVSDEPAVTIEVFSPPRENLQHTPGVAT